MTKSGDYVKLDGKGLVPAIAQNATTGEVLTLGYMSPESVRRTIQSGDIWFYSRSRNELWHKGETSGNYMRLRSVEIDCDGDALLLKVDPEGPSCHTGETTCFFTVIDDLPDFATTDAGPDIVEELFDVIEDRKCKMPEDSYTSSLFKEGTDRISQKVIEEAGETALAGVKGEKQHLIEETADLIYHMLVLLSDAGVELEDVWSSLRARRE